MNISAININKSEDVTSQASINVKSNETQSKGTEAVFGDAVVAVTSTIDKSKMDKNTYASIMEEVSSVEEQIKNSATTAKNSLGALVKRLTGADCVELDKDGFDLNEAKPEDMINIVDRIKIIVATYSEDYVPAGTAIDTDKIQEVTGNVSTAGKIQDKMVESDVAPNIENVAEAEEAVNKVTQMTDLSEDTKNYLVNNELEPSIANVYMAQHSSTGTQHSSYGSQSQGELTEVVAELQPQIEKVIEKAGLEVNEDNLNNAKAFLENDIPVTEENLRYKAELDGINITDLKSEEKIDVIIDNIVQNMSEGNSAESTLLTKNNSLYRDVTEALMALSEIADTPASVLITPENVVELVKSDFNIKDATPEEIIEELRDIQDDNINELAKQMDIDTSDTKVTENVAQLVYDVQKSLYEIKTAPDVVMGAVMAMEEADNSIQTFAEMGSNLKQSFNQASQTYEAVGTEVRRDLGDSLTKAVEASTESILAELGLEDNEENRAAVRILAYNSMEINKDNINEIKSIHSTLKQLINNMKPETVLKMIRDGLNPMNADIDTVNQYLTQENEGVDEVTKYSKFLYKLDKTQGITPEEREQFIGIYKMLNIFEKDAGNAVGALVKQNQEITMSNLITSYNSRKAAGINAVIDETTGMAEVSGVVNYYNNLFNATKDNITPATLKSVNDNQPIADRSVENFCEEINAAYDETVEAEYYEEYLADIQKVTESEESIVKYLNNSKSEVNINNVFAAANLMMPDYFKNVYKLADEDTKETLDSIMEKMDSSKGLEEAYEELEGKYNKLMQETLNKSGDDTYEDINSLRILGKEIGIIQNLAHRNNYKIPFNQDGQIGTINLSLVENGEEQGKIAISMTTEELGTISVEAKLDAGDMGIFAVSDKSTEILNDKLQKISEDLLEDENIHNCQVYTSTSDKVPNISYNSEDKLSTDKMYSLAKKIIIGLM